PASHVCTCLEFSRALVRSPGSRPPGPPASPAARRKRASSSGPTGRRWSIAREGPPMAEPWLTIVGIGEDGLTGLAPGAIAAIGEAELVFGGARHLELAAGAIAGTARPWPSPFAAAIEAVLAAKGRKVCVLASGDPFHYGVGASIARQLDPAQMRVMPHPSAFSLAAARLGWPLQEVVALSLHGRPLNLIRPHLHPATRLLALTSDEH